MFSNNNITIATMQTTTQTTPVYNRLFIRNINTRTTRQTLRNTFSQFGTITNMFIPEHNKCCFISFRTVEEATRAMIALNNTKIDGRIITVEYAHKAEGRQRRGSNSSNSSSSSTGSTSSGRVNVVKYKVPLESFFFNKTIDIEVDGKQYQIPLTANDRSGSQFRIVDDSQSDGSQNETIVELEMEQNEMYERWDDNLIQHVTFDRKYGGMTAPVTLILINGQQYTPTVTLIEGQMLTIKGYGFLKTDGTRADCAIIIHLK